MFIRSVFLVYAVFILVQSGNSSPDEFGTFWGPCPVAPINSSSTVYIGDILGKWYTHRVLGQYSPWKFFDCQTNTISSSWRQKKVNVSSRFDIPGIQLPIEWNGTVMAANKKAGEFNFDYILDNSWYLSQTTTFMQTYFRQGAVLAWTCLDFAIFHIESIAVMTRYQDPNDSRVGSLVYKNMNKTLTNAGISPDWFEPINQFICENDSSSSAISSLLTSSFPVAKGLKSTVLKELLKRL